MDELFIYFATPPLAPTACENSAKNNPPDMFRSFVADIGIAAPATPIFFLRKRNKSKGKVRTNGNLPSGSKSSQPGQWAFCCCRFRLFKLFQDVE